jgi:hypothetical protein
MHASAKQTMQGNANHANMQTIFGGLETLAK